MVCCWWSLLLEMLKKHLCVIRSLSCEKKLFIQPYGAHSHTVNFVTNCFNENVPHYIRKWNWSPNSPNRDLNQWWIYFEWHLFLDFSFYISIALSIYIYIYLYMYLSISIYLSKFTYYYFWWMCNYFKILSTLNYMCT